MLSLKSKMWLRVTWPKSLVYWVETPLPITSASRQTSCWLILPTTSPCGPLTPAAHLYKPLCVSPDVAHKLQSSSMSPGRGATLGAPELGKPLPSLHEEQWLCPARWWSLGAAWLTAGGTPSPEAATWWRWLCTHPGCLCLCQAQLLWGCQTSGIHQLLHTSNEEP